MTIVIACQVFGRYVLNNSPSWSEPVALILMLYVVMLAAAVGVYEGFHLGVRLFVSMLPVELKRAVFVVGQILVMMFGVLMAWNGLLLVEFTTTHIIPTLGVSRSVAYWPFVISGLLIAIFALIRCVVAVRSEGEEGLWN